jgi:hypothetical protein
MDYEVIFIFRINGKNNKFYFYYFFKHFRIGNFVPIANSFLNILEYHKIVIKVKTHGG